MVNTRTDAELAAAVQNALQTLLPQIRAEIREEFRTSSGPSGSGGNPPSVTIHTWLERFNKQKPRSFEKATAPVDTDTETSTEFMQHFLQLAGFLGAAAGVPVMGVTRETGVSIPTDLSILVHRVTFSPSLRIMQLRPQ
nr:hypothetical protein [Tanacetum cinerariifolium]